ncbi:hypothetical protein INS49_004320 [Diaporthe citri]|uniref:uncharacterized protein n=1 Tax=Diaporthe citri TaxID=83186 RepID=UPI001C8071AC|nr:uncharacterized protein INS49_004320 [Diaporthe citri]KAG6355239.1 hypothetical protein INS49_004320 [Diaporthe citri]
MAEENPATPAPAPVPGCHFLETLPVELRLDIYEHFFQGSKVHATLARNTDSSSTQSPAVILRHSEHFKLLLTSRAIHDEALAAYWSTTVLKLECPPLRFGRPSGFRPAKLKLDKYAHRLYASLPEVVKDNVKHIRGMVLPSLKSGFVQENPSLTASALLGTFKKLATCEMSPTLAHPVDGIVSHTKDPENEGFSRFKMIWGEGPMDFLADRYGIDATAGVTFLFKGAIMFSMARDEDNASASLKKSLPQFRNFSTGVAFEDATRKIDDEEGYEKVIQTNL